MNRSSLSFPITGALMGSATPQCPQHPNPTQNTRICWGTKFLHLLERNGRKTRLPSKTPSRRTTASCCTHTHGKTTAVPNQGHDLLGPPGVLEMIWGEKEDKYQPARIFQHRTELSGTRLPLRCYYGDFATDKTPRCGCEPQLPSKILICPLNNTRVCE